MSSQGFLVLTNFGACYFDVDPKWIRALHVAPWVVLPSLLGDSMAGMAASGVAERFGTKSFFLAVEVGLVFTFIADAAFCAWRIALHRVEPKFLSTKHRELFEKIKWRLFGFLLGDARGGLVVLYFLSVRAVRTLGATYIGRRLMRSGAGSNS